MFTENGCNVDSKRGVKQVGMLLLGRLQAECRTLDLLTFVLQPTACLPLRVDQQWPSSGGDGSGRYCAFHRRLIAREPLQVPLSQ